MQSTQTQSATGLTGRLTEIALGYQRTLAQNPRQPQALVGMSLVALASHQTDAAIAMATAAVDAAPRMGTAWVTLGQALKAAKRGDEAEQAYTEAIRLDCMDPLARMGLGELKISTDRAEEAVKDYELALKRNPVLVAAHLGLGHALVCLGRDAEALARYEQTLALSPRLAEAEFSAGFVLARMGRLKQAESRYRRALVLRPDFAAAWMNLGNLLREQGSEAYAEAALLRAVELRPDLINGWLNLALLERLRQRPSKAEEYLRKALALDPEWAATHLAWCQFRTGEQDLAGAWGWLRWAMVREPDNAEVVNAHGILLHKEGRFAEAVEIFKQAEALGSHAASSNRGNSLLDLGHVEEALQAHEKAVERDPACAGAIYNLAMSQLRVGDWERGWPGYEARWDFREVHRMPRRFQQPRWHGEPLQGSLPDSHQDSHQGRRVLLHAEQGLGDSIQFCRYVPLVTARGGTALLQLQTPVERLLGSLAAVRSGQAEIVQPSATPLEFDLECPLMSLPAVFGTTVDSAPWQGAYLAADPALALKKSRQFPDLHPGERPLRVGLAWAGNPKYKADRQRSTQLKTFLPLLRTPGVTWISLQKGNPSEQLTDLPGDVFVHDGSSRDHDLAETAALVDTLDLVICTDTCLAHLAGAMAKPVWILLPYLADWRWMQHRETTPWYPTARLLRQRAPGDWTGLMERVIAELGALMQPNSFDTNHRLCRHTVDETLGAPPSPRICTCG